MRGQRHCQVSSSLYLTAVEEYLLSFTSRTRCLLFGILVHEAAARLKTLLWNGGDFHLMPENEDSEDEAGTGGRNYATMPSKIGKHPILLHKNFTYCRDAERIGVVYYKCTHHKTCGGRGKLEGLHFETSRPHQCLPEKALIERR